MTDYSICNLNADYISNRIFKLIIYFLWYSFIHVWEDILDIVSFPLRSSKFQEDTLTNMQFLSIEYSEIE